MVFELIKGHKVITCTQDFEENPVRVQAIFICGQYAVFRFRPLSVSLVRKNCYGCDWYSTFRMVDGWVYFRRYEHGKYQILLGRFGWINFSIRSMFPRFSFRDLWRVQYRPFPMSRLDFYKIAGEVTIYE